MAKSKYSPALFEVINRQRNTGKLGVPKWWRGSGDAGQEKPPAEELGENPAAMESADAVSGGPVSAETSGPADESGPTAAVLGETTPEPVQDSGWVDADSAKPAEAAVSSRIPAVPAPLSAGPDLRPPMVRIESGRVQLCLSKMHACVACGVMVIALFASYELGRTLGRSGLPAKPANDSLAGVLEQSPNPSALESPDKTGGAAARADAAAAGAKVSKPASGPLKPGLNYIVLDTYKRDHYKSAEHVREWLAANHGIETTIFEPKDKSSYCLMTKGFDYTVAGEKEKCDELFRRVKDLGADCRKELIKADLAVYGFSSPLIKKY